MNANMMNETKDRTRTPAAGAVLHVRERGAGVVIDVRTPFEVSAERLDGAVNIPLEEISARADEIKAMDGERLLLCRSGKRAEAARQALVDAGVEDIRVIEGGILGYVAAGGDTVRGPQRMSLERQVRITAGLLVATGATLGFLVHPGFHAISAFVGAGLVFAGVTDYCGMGLLLARMPWNRV
jgi:rhodanese-related sulfurtransferase